MIQYIGYELQDCPPKYAKPVNSNYYRLMDTGMIEKSNFRSQVELGYGDKNQCEAYALSLAMSIAAANKIKKLYRKKYKHAKIAIIKIKQDHGLVHKDSLDHANWWHPVNFDPTNIANLIEEN